MEEPQQANQIDQTDLTEQVMRAEGYLMQGQADAAIDLLARLAEDVEEYVDRNCPTTEEVQWFSFPTTFDRLAYRAVECDPRDLRDMGEPLDRLYSDLGLAYVHQGDYDLATEALKTAVRWNPMSCEDRLNLAELFRNAGDVQEYLALTYTVFDRASDPTCLVRAYLNFSDYFRAADQPRLSAALLRAASRVDPEDPSLRASLDQAKGTDGDPTALTDEDEGQALDEAGIPRGANPEVVVCLLQCALDARELGDQNAETNYVLRARALAGQDLVESLLAALTAQDDEDEPDAAGGSGVDSDGQA